MSVKIVDVNSSTNFNNVKSSSKSEINDSFSSILNSTLKTTDLDQIFEMASKKYNVPIGLLKAVAKAESNFDTNATSSCGAQGIMQLMPSTARSLGVTDSFDAEQNIMGGAKYLSQMLERFDGDIKLAIAAYNAGAGNVAKYGGIPPFTETQNYVSKVLNFYNNDFADGNATTPIQYVNSVNQNLLSIEPASSVGLTNNSIEDIMLMQIYEMQKNLFLNLNMTEDQN